MLASALSLLGNIDEKFLEDMGGCLSLIAVKKYF